MRDDLVVLLHGVRRLCKRMEAPGLTVDPLDGISLGRAASLLARVTLAGDGGLLAPEAFAEEQDALIARSAALCRVAGVAAPAWPPAVQADRTAAYQEAIGAAVAGLTAKGVVSDDMDGLLCGASDLEQRMAAAADAAIARYVEAWDGRWSDAAAPLLTDERVTAYLRGRFPDLQDLRASQVVRRPGLNANETYFLQLEGNPDWPREAVLRRSLKVQVQPSSVAEEYPVLKAMYDAGLPVPQPLLCDTGPGLDEPFLMVGRLRGDTRNLLEMGEVGAEVFRQLAALLGRLHAMDPDLLPQSRRGSAGAKAWLLERIARFEREWNRGAAEPSMVMARAFYWLRQNVDLMATPPVIVHGDLDQRNILEDGGRIISLIDWEVCHEGHPSEDLAYVRPQVEAMMPWAEFIAIYETNGGHPVDDAQMRYAGVLCNMLRTTTSMVACSGFMAGQSDNFLFATVKYNETAAALTEVFESMSD